MYRLGMTGTALAIGVVLCVLVFAQDRPAAPQGGTENKVVSLCKWDNVAVKDKKVVKEYFVDTTGYSEVRFLIYCMGKDEKDKPRELGHASRREIDVRAYMTAGPYVPVFSNAEKGPSNNQGRISYESVPLKVTANKMSILVFLSELECEQVSYNIEAYLVK